MSCFCGKATKTSQPAKKRTGEADKKKQEGEVFSKTLLVDKPAIKPEAVKVAEEEKEQAKEPVAEPAMHQGSRWCLVEHIMKEGADSEMTSKFWDGIAQMDADTWANMYKGHASKGLYNHWFLPMSKTEMYCLWELREDVSEATFQALLDNEVCPVANNKLMFIDGKLNGGVYGFDTKFAPGQDPEALPPSNAVGEHCLYLVKHDMKPEKKEEWWNYASSFLTDAELGKKYADYQADNHIFCHAMLPISQDCIYCLWEAATSLNKQAIEDILGDKGLVGQGACVNTFLEYDSKLTGGACFIPMKAKEAAVKEQPAAVKIEEQQTPLHQGSRWCLVEHIMKDGADSEMTSKFWAGIAQMDPESWANMYKTNAAKGLYNHWFLPMSKTEMYCLWELREDVSEATFQAFLDNEVCPVAKNKLMFIDGSLNGGNYGFDAKFFGFSTAPGQDPEALPPSNAVGEHCLYLVKHDMKPEKKEEWWNYASSFFTDAELGKKYADYQADNHIFCHAMLPISQDCIYCLWEAATSLNKQAIEDILGDKGLVGQGACVNTFLEYDSKLTGGACFIPMKAQPPVLAEKEPESTRFGMPFFSCLTCCQKAEKDSEIVVTTKDE